MREEILRDAPKGLRELADGIYLQGEQGCTEPEKPS